MQLDTVPKVRRQKVIVISHVNRRTRLQLFEIAKALNSLGAIFRF